MNCKKCGQSSVVYDRDQYGHWESCLHGCYTVLNRQAPVPSYFACGAGAMPYDVQYQTTWDLGGIPRNAIGKVVKLRGAD